jgi:hypothetical protein
VSFIRLLVGDLARTRYFEPLFGTGVRFYLWHFIQFKFLHPAGAPEQTENFSSPVGNPDLFKNPEMGCKSSKNI